MSITTTILEIMEKHNEEAISLFPKYESQSKYIKILDNLAFYSFKTRKCLNQYRPRIEDLM